jgi:molybdopterin-containing oxidoreductase family iron-sulfur binding subunit
VNKLASLRELVGDMRRAPGEAAAVDTLFIIGGNPAYTAPADINFAEELLAFSSRRGQAEPGRREGPLVNFSMHLALYYDETSFNCMWHVPQAHYLEAWGDVRAYGGQASIIQPLISPLYAGRTAHDLLSAVLGEPDASAYDAVRQYWRAKRPGQAAGQQQDAAAPVDPAFEAFWERSLQEGVVEGTRLQAVGATIQPNLRVPPPARPSSGGLEVSFRPDPCVWDGQFANNGWLQELPKPLTKLTWDNAVYVSKRTAGDLGVLIGVHDKASLVNLRYRGRALSNVPVWVWPGHPDGSVTIHLGYGRSRAGRVGGLTGETKSRGFNAYALLTSDALSFDSGLEIQVTGATTRLACTQDHQSIEGRDIARVHTVADLLASPLAHPADKSTSAAQTGHGESEHVSLYPEYDYSKQHAWGMAVDMNACIGCNACTVACQAENNIAVVGPEQVLNGREMHWIRIDTYYRGNPDEDPEAVFQPMLCQHCEKAPCEVVCPVAATTHSHEGLNEMTYNRCVGTRYCSNNCPYKVRRFNFLQYQDKTTPVLKLMRNPSVTVRDRGVMEKCTYCVQRLNGARIEVEELKAQASEAASDGERQELNRRIHATMGRLQTACQQSCPTEAIVFGDLNYIDQQGRKAWVTRLKEQPIHFGVLTELNTQPRTTYLPRLLNPNPAIGEPVEADPPGRRPPGKEARAGA